MRLQRFSVERLFGLFDHVIDLNLNERVTIIHAPNGYGKTIILKMIASFLGGSLATFRQHEFAVVELLFDDQTRVRIEQQPRDTSAFTDEPRQEQRSYKIIYEGGNEILTWSPDEITESLHQVALSSWERFVPNLTRIGPSQWRDRGRDEVLDLEQVAERYWRLLPISAKRRPAQPEWLSRIRSSVHCRLIETQRLVTIQKKDGYGQEPTLSPVVKTYSTELASAIRALLAESATLSQSLDQTFPNRLLVRMRDKRRPPTEPALREKLIQLQQQRLRLSKAGLVEATDESALISHDHFDDNTRRILATYVEDTQKKLEIFDLLLAKLELFTEILNSRFQFKSVSIDRNAGFSFNDFRGLPLPPESLSSGEQHELVLIFDLLFKTNKNTLILIDEPEISLHIAWQKRFLQDLKQIISLTEIDALLATHSPQLIGKYLDLTIQLQAPNGQFTR